jgi:hypothetical protein
MSNSHFVYFIRPVGRDGPIKIGCSAHPVRRLEGLMCWSPQALEVLVTLPGDFKLEGKLHRLFAKSHDHNEWFRETPRLLKLIDDLKAGTPVYEAIDLDAAEGKIRQPTKGRWSDAKRMHTGYMRRFYCHMRKRGSFLHWYSALPERAREILERARKNECIPSQDERRYLDNLLAEPLEGVAA